MPPEVGACAALAWSERSRMQIGGTWAQFSLGTSVGDRNHVVERDLSSISKPAASGSAPGSASASSPAGGPTVAPYAAGAVAASVVAGGVVAWRRRAADGDAEPVDVGEVES